MKKNFDVLGMSCAACSSRVEKVVNGMNGVQNASVNLLTNSMTVEYDDNVINSNNICEAVNNAGYKANVFGEKSKEVKGNKKNSELENMYHRLKSSIIFLIPLFYISMSRMVNWPMPRVLLEPQNLGIFSLILLILVIPIMFINRKFFIVGYKSLWRKAPNMDTLIDVGTTASFLYGLYSMFMIEYALGIGDINLAITSSEGLYFESAGMILTLITVGKTLETRSKGKTSEAIEKLMDMAPKTAILFNNHKEIEIPVEQIKVGDKLLIKPGNSVPVDGIVISGGSSIDESALTGESIPVSKEEGDEVLSGSINQTGSIIIEARKVGEDTTLSGIIKLVEEATSTKAPIARLADKIAGVFVPIVLSIALLTFIVWYIISKDFQMALTFGISIMVISCPCALGLATPVAIMVGTGKGASNGILFKSAEAIETMHKGKVVVLDKTGTITTGNPIVTDIVSLNGMNDDLLLQIASSLENYSEHPLAKAIINKAQENEINLLEVFDFDTYSGLGLSAKIDGDNYFAGNIKLMHNKNINVKQYSDIVDRLSNEGKTVMYFANANNLIGLIAVADKIKKDSKLAISEMKKLGIKVYMLTGDNKLTANAVGKKVGVDKVVAEVLPKDKEELVHRLQDEGKNVIMVGDGINDAPALTRANVGIAIGAGSDIAIESADVILMKSSLLDVVSAIELSKATIRNIKENLFWALFYNLIGIPIAAGILYPFFGLQLKPWIAAAAMSLSSVTVVTNALRLKSFKATISSKDIEKRVFQKELSDDKKNYYIKSIAIDGMKCVHCKAKVENIIKSINGVDKVIVNLETKTAKIFMERKISEEIIVEKIEKEGYSVMR